MLGRDVVRAAQLSGHEVVAADRATLDITDSARHSGLLRATKPPRP